MHNQTGLCEDTSYNESFMGHETTTRHSDFMTFRSFVFSRKVSVQAILLAGIIHFLAVIILYRIFHSTNVGVIGVFIVGIVAWFYGLSTVLIAAPIYAVITAAALKITSPLGYHFLSNWMEAVFGFFLYMFTGILFGWASHMVSILRAEISYRKKIEEELTGYKNHLEDLVTQRTKELETANEYLSQTEKMDSLGQLTGGIAHDFNNMLTGIFGYGTMIQKKFAANNPALDKYISAILKTSTDAANLVGQLLSFSRKAPQEAAEIDLHETIANAVNILKHSIHKGIFIEQRLNAQAGTVMGNSAALQSVFLNLGINARDAMPNGGTLIFETSQYAVDEEYLKSHPGNLRPGVYIMISVTDTGTGIDEAVQKRIFEPFFTTKAKGKGTGMGLATSYGTIKSHNGAIEVYSQKGKGSTFKIYLPISSQRSGSAPSPALQIIRGTGHILLVDDDEAIRTTAVEMLESLGYTATACASGAEALDLYIKDPEKFDAVLLDAILPEMDGYTCFTRLKQINPRVRAVFVSGFALHGEHQKLIDQEAAGYVQKPFDLHRLSSALHGAILKK